MKATVETVLLTGSVDTPHGILNVFSYTFAGEDIMFSARHKNSHGFKAGSIVEFTPKFINNEGVSVGSVTAYKEPHTQPKGAFPPPMDLEVRKYGGSASDHRLDALNAAVRFSDTKDIKEVLSVADTFLAWIKVVAVLLLVFTVGCSVDDTTELYVKEEVAKIEYKQYYYEVNFRAWMLSSSYIPKSEDPYKHNYSNSDNYFTVDFEAALRGFGGPWSFIANELNYNGDINDEIRHILNVPKDFLGQEFPYKDIIKMVVIETTDYYASNTTILLYNYGGREHRIVTKWKEIRDSRYNVWYYTLFSVEWINDEGVEVFLYEKQEL